MKSGHWVGRLWVAVIVAGLSWPAGWCRAGEHKVEPMTIEALENRIQSADQHLLVVAMAAWCTPCREELPALTRLFEKYRDRGLQVIGISVDDQGPAGMQPIVDRLKVSFPVYWVGEEAIEHFQIRAVPLLIFVKDGRELDRFAGRRPEWRLRELFDRFVAGKPLE